MANDPLTDAMDDVEEEQQREDRTRRQGGFDVEGFLEELGEGTKSETIGIAVTEEQRAVWKELRKPSSEGGTDVDLAQAFRDLIDKHANMNKTAAERAGRKLEIDRMNGDE